MREGVTTTNSGKLCFGYQGTPKMLLTILQLPYFGVLKF